MRILEELISSLDFDAPVMDIRQGVFHTGVLTRYCGLAATLPRDALTQEPPLVKEPGSLLSKTALQLARQVYSQSILEAAIGMATINSLLEVEEKYCKEINAADVILNKGRDKRIAIVGHFPFVPRIREKSKALWVIDKNPEKADFSETAARDLIPQADVVALTGTSLTNHSFQNLVDQCNPKAYVIILGDTAPLSQIFFEHGVDAVSGTKVIDPNLALRCVSEGANFRQIQGVRRLTLMK